MIVRFPKMLVLMLSVIFTACSKQESKQEQMVNLQQIADNPDAQLNHLNAAIAQSTRDESLFARRSVVLLRKGQLEKALEDANKAVELTKKDPASLFVKAQVLRAMGREEEAFPLALQAERNAYQSSSLYVLLGDLYFERDNYTQALEYLNKAHKISPTDEFAFYYKGKVLSAAGDSAKAMYNYKLALEHAPDFMEAKRELAGLYIAQSNFSAAEPYLEQARKVAPTDGKLLYLKGLDYLNKQQPDSAQQFLAKAVSVNDTLQGAHFQLGMLLHSQGDNAGAITHLEKAAKAYKNQPKYITTLASSYERTGQYAKSLAQYQRLIKLKPEYTFAYQSISRLKYKLQKPEPDSTTVYQERVEQ